MRGEGISSFRIYINLAVSLPVSNAEFTEDESNFGLYLQLQIEGKL